MTITLTGTGGVFTRVGKLGGCLNNVNGLIGNTATDTTAHWGASGPLITDLGHQIDAIEAQYQSNDQNLMDGLYAARENFRQSQSSFKSFLQQLAQNTVTQQANRDSPLAVVSLANALQLLITQMVTAGASVQSSTVAAGAQTSVGSPTGTPSIVVSVKDGTGRVVEYAVPDVMTFRVVSDSYTGGATAGQEQLLVSGQAAQGVYGDTGVLDWDYPFGSGASQNATAVDASVFNTGGSTGNLTVNGQFVNCTTTNYPDNWVNLAGVIGTNVLQSSTTYDGTKSMQFAGTGGTAASMTQPLNTASATGAGAGGSPAVLLPSTQYAFNCWVSVSATPAAGVLSFDLTDGSNVVLNDMQGTANTVTQSLTAFTGAWSKVFGTFRTPAVLPTNPRFRIRLSTDIESGKSCFISRVALTPVASFYQGGPSLAVFSGATKLVNGASPDQWTVAITNTFGVMQKVFQRFFNLTSLQPTGASTAGLILPSSGSPTIADSLVA